MLLAAFGASVQAQDFTKKELAKAAKMAKNKKWRKPLPYFMKDDFKCESTIYQLSKIDSKDIAAMKINAVEGRGSRKDFIDIYMLLQHYTLDELLDFYQKKYPNYSIFRALLSLTYFDDADSQAMPKMFIPETWDEMKSYISKKVKEYNRSLVSTKNLTY